MSLVRDLIKRFPLNHVRSSFGYGSSVFPQKGNDGKDRQIDMILICDSLKDFHRKLKNKVKIGISRSREFLDSAKF